ncbi:MAG TPA: hypothetical protein VEG66_08020 [Thermoplasmata archaeon]|jgi:polyferredoxin|nr:hypothetical protein [Thermoplasmata archaeon]
MPEEVPLRTPRQFRVFLGVWLVTAVLFLGSTGYYAVKAAKSPGAVSPMFVDAFVVIILLFLTTTFAFLVASP